MNDNRIPAPEHVEATFTANAMAPGGITIWELEYLFSIDLVPHETRGIFFDREKHVMHTRWNEDTDELA